MRDDDKRQLKIELLSQWKLEAESRKIKRVIFLPLPHLSAFQGSIDGFCLPFGVFSGGW